MIEVVRSPEVYILSRLTIDRDGLGRFLAAVGAPDWASDATSYPAELVEVCGRLCYDSFRAPRPGGNAAYIGHLLEIP